MDSIPYCTGRQGQANPGPAPWGPSSGRFRETDTYLTACTTSLYPVLSTTPKRRNEIYFRLGLWSFSLRASQVTGTEDLNVYLS